MTVDQHLWDDDSCVCTWVAEAKSVGAVGSGGTTSNTFFWVTWIFLMMILIHKFDDVVYVYVYVYAVFVVDDVDDDQAGREPLQQVVCIAPFDEAPGQL